MRLPRAPLRTSPPMARLQILFLENEQNDVMLVKRVLDRHFTDVTLKHARSHGEYLEYLDTDHFDLVLSDHSIPGCEGLKAFHIARDKRPRTPFIYLSGFDDPERDIHGLKALGVSDFVSKSELFRLPPVIEKAIEDKLHATADSRLLAGYEHLVGVINQLSLARDLPGIMAIVRKAARELTGADGATFVLREGELCHYVDEDAIGPLWKGQKFPVRSRISGWAMTHRQPAIVEDIYNDPRIPAAAYESTFVRSVAMVPIRSMEPIGAIGAYWATPRLPEQWEVRLLQALADTTAVAMENVRIHAELEQRVCERTAELEAFSYAVSHDLRAPLRHVKAFSAILVADHGEQIDEGMRYNLQRISSAIARMTKMIDSLLQLSVTGRAPVRRTTLNLTQLAREIAEECNASADRPVDFAAPDSIPVAGDAALLRLMLQNLLDNAWKFSGGTPSPHVELGVQYDTGGRPIYFLRDNGAGFDERDAGKLFGVFQRLHLQSEFPGTGVGLAIVQRIVSKHDGKIWATGKPGKGATFCFTLGEDAPKT